ncbi:MAG: DNA starvation/stationary phase protection protein [Rhodobacteraceae bacterium]|nr:MAG: DNA starvation/stationary phase protection protein [Paracoccaceae bacterium]
MVTTLQKSPVNLDAGVDILNSLSLAEAVAGVLTDTYRLVLKSHAYHWNVTGPMFFSVHALTEAQYTEMFAAVDVLAERIRALGKPAMVRLSGLVAGPGGRDPDAGLSAEEMVRDLQADHEALAQRMRALVERAEAVSDPVTADIATTRAAFHEKAAWMLRATVA